MKCCLCSFGHSRASIGLQKGSVSLVGKQCTPFWPSAPCSIRRRTKRMRMGSPPQKRQVSNCLRSRGMTGANLWKMALLVFPAQWRGSMVGQKECVSSPLTIANVELSWTEVELLQSRYDRDANVCADKFRSLVQSHRMIRNYADIASAGILMIEHKLFVPLLQSNHNSVSMSHTRSIYPR